MAWTDGPQGFDAVKKMGPAFSASHLPRMWDVGQAPSAGRPDTRWCGGLPHRRREANPDSVRHAVDRGKERLTSSNPYKGGSTLDPSGYDAGKKAVGRKRHILTDTLGL
jgi:hypothetical protein